MKVLLATDGSVHSKAMIKEFSRRTFTPDTKVRIISAYENSIMEYDYPMGAINEYNAKASKYLMKSATDAIESAATILSKKQPNIIISVAAIEGYPKSVILAEAKKYGADLIVVGSHGHRNIADFLMGSVSQAVAFHAKCSVEIVRIRMSK